MNQVLRKIAIFIGLGVLGISMFWSQDGFNFDVAGDSGYGNIALFIGWFLAVSVSVVEFVFSSNFRDLNPSLIVFGILAYVYSIYTNYQGITHFQGLSQSHSGAWILAVIMDSLAEPLIAWGLYESQTGDFIGNLIKALVSAPNKIQQENRHRREEDKGSQRKPEFRSPNRKINIPPELQRRLQQKKHEGKKDELNRFDL